MSKARTIRTIQLLVFSLLLWGCPPAAETPDAGGVENGGSENGGGDADAGPSCQTDENHPCQLHPGCGCDEGDTCDLDPDNEAAGHTFCRAAGSVASLTECVPSAYDCGQGEICVGQPTGVCRKYCSEHADCGPDEDRDYGGFCRPIRSGSGNSPQIPGAAVCSTYCNPFDPQDSAAPFMACPDGVGCRMRDAVMEPADLSSPPTTDCTLADETKLEGDECNVFCAVGLMCLPDADNTLRCQKPCTCQEIGSCGQAADGGAGGVGGAGDECTEGTCTFLNLVIFPDADPAGVVVGYCKLSGNEGADGGN
jgi:hypothetical protein